jgi:hypothetical protein
MRKLWIGLICLIGSLMVEMAGSVTVRADDPTPTHTPTSTAAFVLPFVNIPIVLPTAYLPPLPTAIPLSITAAPGNPLGLTGLPANPVWAWNEGMNYMAAIWKLLGWAGYLLFFVLMVRICLGLLNQMRRTAMGQPSLYSKAQGSSGGRRR